MSYILEPLLFVKNSRIGHYLIVWNSWVVMDAPENSGSSWKNIFCCSFDKTTLLVTDGRNTKQSVDDLVGQWYVRSVV